MSYQADNTNVTKSNKRANAHVKANFKGDLRRFVIDRNNASFDELRAQVARQYQLQEERVSLTFCDDEDDQVTLASDADLELALSLVDVLRLEVQGRRMMKFKKAKATGNADESEKKEDDETVEVEDDLPASIPKHVRQRILRARQQRRNRQDNAEDDEEDDEEDEEDYDECKPFDRHSHRRNHRGGRGFHRHHHHHHHRGGRHCGRRNRWWAPSGDEKEEPKWRRWQRRDNGEEVEEDSKPQKQRFKARFVKHIGVQEGAVLEPEQQFSKIWRIRNAGDVCWPTNVELVYISSRGDQMDGPQTLQVKAASELAAGAEIEVSVDLIAPKLQGEYEGFYRLRDIDTNRKFGQRLRTRILVVDPNSSPDEATKSDAVDSDIDAVVVNTTD